MTDDFSQCYLSEGLGFFKTQILKSWNCVEYYDPNKPAIFVGIYHKEDIEALANHNSYKILFLGGSDYDNVKLLKNVRNTFCPVFSHSLHYQLSRQGVICKPWPVSVRDFSHIPTNYPLGEKIYVYSGNNQRDYLKDESGLNKGLYKECIAPLVEELGKEKFIFAKQLSMNDLIESVYKNSFIFIKPNELGGNSAMWELAHMGRKTISCGMYDAPNIHNVALNYSNKGIKYFFNKRKRLQYPTKNVTGYTDIDEIINLIKFESINIGKQNYELIKKVKNLFSELPWKNLEFWL